jgi:hypothetical protein
MRDDQERISQIGERRGSRDTVQLGSPYDGGGIGGAAPIAEIPDQSVLGVDFKSPWLRDRVSLSLEAQIAMMEQRATYRANIADLGYTNRLSIIPIRPGIFIKVEPTGCYRLVYNNR